jgi:hypothetical protein
MAHSSNDHRAWLRDDRFLAFPLRGRRGGFPIEFLAPDGNRSFPKYEAVFSYRMLLSIIDYSVCLGVVGFLGWLRTLDLLSFFHRAFWLAWG